MKMKFVWVWVALDSGYGHCVQWKGRGFSSTAKHANPSTAEHSDASPEYSGDRSAACF